MAYRVDAGIARESFRMPIQSENFDKAALLGNAAHPSQLNTFDADAASTFSAHSPFDAAVAAQANQATAASTVDSGLLARLDALLPNAPDGFVMRCACPACMKTAIAQLSGDHDAQGPHSVGIGNPATTFVLDDIPDDNSSTVSLNVQEGQQITSVIDTQVDQDWFVVNLSDTNSYEFTLTPTDTDGTTGPDLILSIYDEDGNLIEAQDGHSFGGGEELTFTPTTDGTYYVGVSSYASLPNAEYTIFGGIDNTPDPNAGTPLEAIDWGGTANRVNTDGVESPNGDDVIQFYFAKTGEVYESALAGVTVAQDWQQFEKDAAYTAFEQYDHIINTDYVEVATAAEADFVLISHAFEPNILGVMAPPGEPHEGQAEFNNQGVGWTESGLEQGAFGFITLIHELGHGHGLAHPHDTGGGSTVMQGVVEEPPPSALDYTTGDFGLNNGVYTTMSYNDGWDKDGPNGAAPTNDWGYQGTLMAFDVAVLQQKYGANMTYKTGNDVYALPDVNEAGTFYSCIWDAGGEDTIRASKTLDSVIDLRPATLEYELGGGGWVSWADGIFGGYTIANGVVVENAVGRKGADTITGNDAANGLKGGHGGDSIDGGAGRDTINGGNGVDELMGGVGRDTFVFHDHDTHRNHADTIHDLVNGDTIDVSGIDANENVDDDQAFTLVDDLDGTAGQLAIRYDSDSNTSKILMDTDGNGRADLAILVVGDVSGYSNFDL